MPITQKKYYLTALFSLLTIFSFSQDGCILQRASGYPIIQSPRCGDPNGSIEVLYIGVGVVTYQLNNEPPQTSGLFQNLSSGTYTITVSDESGCQLQPSFPLEGQQSITINSVDITKSDCNASNGSIVVSATGNQLQYSLDNGAYQDSPSFTGLEGGIYQVNILDADDCVEARSVTVPEGSIELNDIDATNTTCYDNNGTIQVDATGNQLEYRIEGVRGWGGPNFNNLSPGLYTVEIKDAEDCTYSENVRIRSLLDYDLSIRLPNCGETDGRITVTVNSPGDYEYSLDDGETYQASNVFSNLNIGQYWLRIRLVGTDCYIRRRVVIDQNTEIDVWAIDKVRPICNSNEGSISINASGNDLTYILSDDTITLTNNTGIFRNLAASNYSIRIENTEGCYRIEDGDLPEYNDIQVSNISTRPSNCSSPQGRADITAYSERGYSLQYSLDGGETYTDNPNITELFPGEYTLTVLSASSCLYETQFSIPSTTPIIVDGVFTSTPTSNCSEDGSIEVIASGDGLEYSLDEIIWQESNVFDGLNPGDFIVYIRSANNCETETGTITLPTNFRIDTIETNFVYCNQPKGIADITASGSSLQYKVDNSPYQDEPHFENLTAGDHIAYVLDVNTCVIEQPFTIESIGGIDASNYNIFYDGCGETNASVELLPISDQNDFRFEMISSSRGISTNQETGPTPNPVFSNLGVGTYRFRITNEVDCEAEVDVTITEVSEVEFFPLIEDYICFYHLGSITVSNAGGVGQMEYSLDSISFTPSNRFTDLQPGEYTAYTRDEVGCIDTLQFEIDYKCLPLVPNTFAPNNNNANERLVLKHEQDLYINYFKVFNSWGELVYEAYDFNISERDNFWDGNGAQSGTYLYDVSFIDADETEQQLSGTVHLIR